MDAEMGQNDGVMRAWFETWIASPPFERDVDRWPQGDGRTAWPGQYKDLTVEVAWEAWKASQKWSLEKGESLGVEDTYARWWAPQRGDVWEWVSRDGVNQRLRIGCVMGDEVEVWEYVNGRRVNREVVWLAAYRARSKRLLNAGGRFVPLEVAVRYVDGGKKGINA